MLHVRHISALGKPYFRVHVIKVRPDQEPLRALQDDGVFVANNITVYVERAEGFGFLHNIRFVPDMVPVVRDPSSVVVDVAGIPGGVYIDVPYRCVPKQLVDDVIPDKLRRLGVHAHDCRGAPFVDGRVAKPCDFWRPEGARLQWTKLRVPVEHQLSDVVLRGICAMQKRFREKQDDFCFIH